MGLGWVLQTTKGERDMPGQACTGSSEQAGCVGNGIKIGTFGSQDWISRLDLKTVLQFIVPDGP